MSASREKKTRQTEAANGPTPREQKRQQEAQEARRRKLLYTVVGLVCVVLAVGVIFWNSGIMPRTMPAVTINGKNYTAVDVQYYFNSTRTAVLNQYYSQIGITPFDNSTSTKDQVYNSETGETWYEKLMEQALETMTTNMALADKAQAEGFTMTQETRDGLNNALEELETAWVGTPYSSRDAYLRATYGPYISYDRFVELLNRDLLASDYGQSVKESFTYTDEDYEAYYQENADDLDTYTISQFTFRASVDTTDEEGNTIEMTDEEKADALAQAQEDVKAVAEELQERLEAGEDPQTLADAYADQLSSSNVSELVTGSSLNSQYSDWAKDSARKAGDVTLVDVSASSTSAYCYVVLFEDRQRDDNNTADVRHILIRAEVSDGAEAPTEEQYAAAQKEAEDLLAQWKAGEATEESFVELAKEYSDDSSVSGNEGLFSGISASSGYAKPFLEWALDDHQPGETGIVRNDSNQGFHIMYYVGSGEPGWKLTAGDALREESYSSWEEEIAVGYEAVSRFGLNFISG